MEGVGGHEQKEKCVRNDMDKNGTKQKGKSKKKQKNKKQKPVG